MSNTCTKVHLRRCEYAGDKISLYLDYWPPIRNPYTNRLTRRESLGIVIYANPKNEAQRRFNREMEEKAEAIRCVRYQSLINEQFGFLDKAKQKMDFVAYFERKAHLKYDKWKYVLMHFKNFCGGKCTFGEITQEFCEEFREYLLYANNLRYPDKEVPLSQNSASGYWATFRALLKMAFKEKFIPENFDEHLDGIKWQEVRKEYFTIEEMKKLAATPCESARRLWHSAASRAQVLSSKVSADAWQLLHSRSGSNRPVSTKRCRSTRCATRMPPTSSH